MDVDAIFELEDEYEETALESHEIVPTHLTGKAPSVHHVPSMADGRHGQSPSRPSAFQTGSSPKRTNFPASSAKPGRMRMNSIVGRGVEGPSPLAQMYQPLVVLENEETEPIGTGIGHGRPNRRQPLPMHRRSQTEIQPHQKTPNRSPAIDSDRSPGSFFQSLDDLSGQRQLLDEPDNLPETETSEEGQTALTRRLLARLDGMEERQIRIEELLANLSTGIKSIAR